MKRLLFLCLTVLMLASCVKSPAPPLSMTDTETDTAEPEPAIDRASETLSFLASSEAYYSDGTLYSTGKNLLLYTPLETGEARPLCFDPLCQHEYGGTCTARVNHPKSRMIVKDGMCWFTAVTPTRKLGDVPVYQLRVMDVASGKVRVLYEQDTEIHDFWLLGDDLILSVPYSVETTTDQDGRMFGEIMGGSLARLDSRGKTTVVLEDPDGQYPILVASDNGALYVAGKYGTTPIYLMDYAFSARIPVTDTAPMGFGMEIFDGWIYYIRSTGESVREEGEAVDGEFDPEVSVFSVNMAVGELVRQKIDGGEVEILCPAVPIPRVNAGLSYRLFGIDRNANALYYVPLDLSYDGYVIWEFDAEQKAFAAQMGSIHDKPILTKKFSLTGGRLVRLALDTMERRDILSDCGADIVDLYAVEAGRVWARFELYDVDEIKAKMAAGVKSDSMLTYAYTGSEEILP